MLLIGLAIKNFYGMYGIKMENLFHSLSDKF